MEDLLRLFMFASTSVCLGEALKRHIHTYFYKAVMRAAAYFNITSILIADAFLTIAIHSVFFYPYGFGVND